MLLRRGVALAALLALAGCAAPQHDPMEGVVAAADPALKRLSVGLVVTEGTRATFKQAEEWNAQAFGPGLVADPKAYVARFTDLLRQSFRSVMPLARKEDAAAAGVDLVVEYDLHYGPTPMTRFSKSETDMRAVVYTPELAPVADIAARRAGGHLGWSSPRSYTTALGDDAFDQLGNDFLASPELVAYARKRAGALVAAPAAAAPQAPWWSPGRR